LPSLFNLLKDYIAEYIELFSKHVIYQKYLKLKITVHIVKNSSVYNKDYMLIIKIYFIFKLYLNYYIFKLLHILQKKKIENSCLTFLTERLRFFTVVLASSFARVIFVNRRRQLPEGFAAGAGSFRRIRD